MQQHEGGSITVCDEGKPEFDGRASPLGSKDVAVANNGRGGIKISCKQQQEE